MLINQDQIKTTTIFLPNDHVRKIPSTKSGLHLAGKDAGKQVPACNRRRRFCTAIHQLMPEHFKTTHNLQGRFQRVEKEYVGLKTELAMPVCSTKLQRTQAAMQRTSQLHRGGWKASVLWAIFTPTFPKFFLPNSELPHVCYEPQSKFLRKVSAQLIASFVLFWFILLALQDCKSPHASRCH